MTPERIKSILPAVEIYERLQHQRDTSLDGKCYKNDKELWRMLDDAEHHTFYDVAMLAMRHPQFTDQLDEWCVSRHNHIRPFRDRKDKMRTSTNNNSAWKMLMLFREVIERWLREQQQLEQAEIFDDFISHQ